MPRWHLEYPQEDYEMSEKAQTTNMAKVVRDLGIERACVLELPHAHTHAIVQLDTIPPQLGFPRTTERPVYTVMNSMDNDFPASGAHSHKLGTESEIMFAPAGCAQVWIWDQDGNPAMFELRPPKPGERMKAVFVPAGLWHTVRYAPSTVLNVVASCKYDRSYYVTNPADFFTEAGLRDYQTTLPPEDCMVPQQRSA